MEPFVHSENHSEQVRWLTLQSWQQHDPRLRVGFSTRMGGVSEDEFQSLNCGLHVLDQPEHVLKNRKRLAEAAGFIFESWTAAEQVHASKVAVIDSAFRGRGRLKHEDTVAGFDAMVTNEEDIILTAVFADCVPLYFYDPTHHAVGIAHAGWRGTAGEIAASTIRMMTQSFGSQPEHILAAIGPSIGKCCYEVDEKVVQAMQDIDGFQASCTPSQDEKYMLDLKEMNRHIMIKAGILQEHIEISTWCTSCRTDLFYSHRKEQGRTGRMAGWIGLQGLR